MLSHALASSRDRPTVRLLVSTVGEGVDPSARVAVPAVELLDRLQDVGLRVGEEFRPCASGRVVTCSRRDIAFLSDLLVLHQAAIDEGSKQGSHVLSSFQSFDGGHRLRSKSGATYTLAGLTAPFQEAAPAALAIEDLPVGHEDHVAELGCHFRGASLGLAGAIFTVEVSQGSVLDLLGCKSKPIFGLLELGVSPGCVVVDKKDHGVERDVVQVDALFSMFLSTTLELVNKPHILGQRTSLELLGKGDPAQKVRTALTAEPTQGPDQGAVVNGLFGISWICPFLASRDVYSEQPSVDEAGLIDEEPVLGRADIGAGVLEVVLKPAVDGKQVADVLL